MLIDLGRNDVGRVAQTGSVQVTEQMVIERYSHVMHIVSNVEGKLRPGLDAIDVLRASFPAGTLTGAPKVRAMEIIDELEPVKRGVYGGAVGYLGFDGDMDLAIAIRTAVRQGRQAVRAGRRGHRRRLGARDSEWQETQNKARAVLRAAELVARRASMQPLDGGSACSLHDRQLRLFTYNLVQYLGELGADVQRRAQRRDHARRDRGARSPSAS